jgi:serine/threonine protein kinase
VAAVAQPSAAVKPAVESRGNNMSISKDAALKQSSSAIDAIMSGREWLDPNVDGTSALTDNIKNSHKKTVNQLTMETQILALIGAGMNNHEITLRLNTNSETIALVMHSIIERSLKKAAKDNNRRRQAYSTKEWLTNLQEIPFEQKVFLDKYLIENLIGSGSLGAVFKAKHLYMNRYVALKLLRPELCSDRLTMRYFKREAMAIASLQHKNIVGVHDFGISEEYVPYLIMEFINGTNLASILEKEHRLSARRTINICIQVCAGLAQAHSKGIVHCDLKPSNILMLGSEPKETVKIVDFGLAQDLPTKITTELRSTDQFFVNGTPLYMSPEQCIGTGVDARSDIYSLGCILYEALTGVNFFEGATAMESLVKQCHVVPPPMSSIYPGLISARLDSCVSNMLAKDPAARPQSMEEVMALLLSSIK